MNEQSSSEIKSIFASHGYFKRLYLTRHPHIHPMNTRNLQPNMVLPTQQAAHAIFKVTGKQKAVKAIKSLLNKNDDLYIALMTYWSLPRYNGFLSSELLMNRRLHTTLPILDSALQSSISKYSVVHHHERETMRKANSKKFDTRHRAYSYSRYIASRKTRVDIGEER